MNDAPFEYNLENGNTGSDNSFNNPFDNSLNNGHDGGLIASLSGLGQSSSGIDAGDEKLLQRNLRALAHRSPFTATQIQGARSRSDIRFVETPEGVLSAEIEGKALASKKKPMREAKLLSERIDPEKIACCAVIGFGVGHHCNEIAERLGSYSVVVCFEPDLGLLRSVLSRIDYTELFASGRFILLTDVSDPTVVTKAFEGLEGVVGLGVEILEHPPSKVRIGELGDAFGRVLSNVMKAARTSVMTTLANARVSFNNGLMNLDHYSTSAGILGLKDSCKDRCAVVVSAGPSLEKNIDQLSDPSVRESVVVIAVQTVLKPMLKRGIKPDFVAALDYHELSKRFYEGLSEHDVEGIRLIVEPKANPVILDSFPGEVLCVNDDLLDRMLGNELARDLGDIKAGATVAHLCYYFARYLGCDPVIFIGQDLGFTDGQYYAQGAAIHNVWGGELSSHRTLEMMEWERIVRMRAHLRQREDVHGRPIYTDEQMSAYLAQFESDFHEDVQRGLMVIDASEGGVRKAHAKSMTLQDALESLKSSRQVPIQIPSTQRIHTDDENRSQEILNRLKAIGSDCERIVYLSEKSIELLEGMLKNQDDQSRVNKLISEVNSIRDRVMKMEDAFKLCESVNQIGVLNRMRRDRAIEVTKDDDAMDRQHKQIQRDITNVEWTRDAARAVSKQLQHACSALFGQGSKQTNEINEHDQQAVQAEETAQLSSANQHQSVHGLVLADPVYGGLGNKRDLSAAIAGGMNALQLTLSRLDRTCELNELTVVTPDVGATKSIIGTITLNKPINIVGVDEHVFRRHAHRIGSARTPSSECWRGSIGMLSVYDEQLHPGLVAQVMESNKIGAVAVVGADWAMVDPELVDQTVGKYRVQTSGKRIAFTHATPGIGTMVVDRETMVTLGGSMESEAADSQDGSLVRSRNHFATLGALISYIPIAPQFDPIGKGMCVRSEPSVRDASVRMIADSTARIATIRDAYQAMKSMNAVDVRSVECVRSYEEAFKRYNRICPKTIVLESCTGRLAVSDWGIWKRNSIEPVERAVLTMNDANTLIRDACSIRDDVSIVFDGVGDPLMHPSALSFAQLAKEDGALSVELRTDLLREGIDAKELLESGVDILSVDILAEQSETYKSLTGQDRLEDVYARVQTIFDELRSGFRDGSQSGDVWFVPRMTRCDAVYNEIESFYDKWLMLCGSAVLDPLPQRVSNQRIQRLPIPASRQYQLDRNTMYVGSDGTVLDRIGRAIGGTNTPINVFDEGISQAYQRMCTLMRSKRIELKPEIKADSNNANPNSQKTPEHAA
jgi:hypothetical protein